MNNSTLVTAQLCEPLRAYALTVEQVVPGEFRWRILENHGARSVFEFESVCCADTSFAAYDTALATGYGELQRLIGPDLQFGPRREPESATQHVKLLASAAAGLVSAALDGVTRPISMGETRLTDSLQGKAEALRG